MTHKITLTNLVNLQNETTAVNAINGNNAALTASLDNTLSRDGSVPNQMASTLDMNSNRIINLPSPISTTEPITLSYFNTYITTGQGASGLTGVPVSAAMQPIVDASTLQLAGLNIIPQMFGALGGSTDDTVALQNWINYCQSNGVEGHLTTQHKTSAPLNITAAMRIIGNGVLTSGILPGNHVGININTARTCSLEHFSIFYISTPSVGSTAVIKTSPTGQLSLNDRFEDIYVNGAYVGFSIDRSNIWIMDNCLIDSTVSDGMVIQNTTNADEGDGCINGTTFAVIGGNAISYLSGGGLSIINTKVSNAVNGLVLNASPSINTGDLFITNSSFEGISNIGVVVERQASSANWQNIIIQGCEFESFVAVAVATDPSNTWLQNLVCANNIWIGTTAANSTMYSIDSTNNFSILGGTAEIGGGSTPRKFLIGSGATNGVIGMVSGSSFTASDIGGTGITSIAPF